MVPAAPPPKVTLSLVKALSYFTAALSVAACASLTDFNCPPFTASFELAATVPSATFVSLIDVVVEPFASCNLVATFAATTSVGEPMVLPPTSTAVDRYHFPSFALVSLFPVVSV